MTSFADSHHWLVYHRKWVRIQVVGSATRIKSELDGCEYFGAIQRLDLRTVNTQVPAIRILTQKAKFQAHTNDAKNSE
jgi:hypothetical protein